MVIRNEEQTLDRALKSAASLTSEIIIVHDGKCTDNSLKIAKKYTKKIFIKKFIGEAEPHRVFTYEKSQYPWILQLDADEFLSKKLAIKITKLIKKENTIYEFSWPIKHNHQYFFGGFKRALFKKESIYYLGIPHSSVSPINKKIKVIKIKEILNHEPKYENLNTKTFLKKWKKWAHIQANYYKKDFSKIPKFNYPYKYWPKDILLRIKHPIILGMIGSPLFHFSIWFFRFLKYKKNYYLKEAFYKSWYFFLVYYYLWKKS